MTSHRSAGRSTTWECTSRSPACAAPSAPPAGILIYQWLESLRPGLGRYSLVLPLVFVTVGAIGFSHMRRVMRAQGKSEGNRDEE